MNNGVNKFNLRTLLAAIEGLDVPYIEATDNSDIKDFEVYLSPQEPILVEEAKEASNMSTTSSHHETSRRENKTLHNVSDSHDTTKYVCFEIGTYESNNVLKLNAKDVKRCQKYFILLARNRSKFLKEMKKQIHCNRNGYVEPSHKPKLSKRSKILFKGLHEKLSENKIPHYELLLYKGKEYEKNRERTIKEKEQRELKIKHLTQKVRSPRAIVEDAVKIYDILDEEIPDDFGLYKRVDDSLDGGQVVNFDAESSSIESDTFTSRLKQSIEEDSNSPSKEGHGYPILFVDINIGKNHIERITIYEGDDPNEVAREFSETHNLNDKMFEKLQNMLQQQMSGILSRIKEEEYEEACDTNSIEK
jgi:hypothetical protein